MTETKSGGKTVKIAVIALIVVALLAVGVFAFTKSSGPAKDYKAAVELLNAGNYEAALNAFQLLGDYKDSADKVQECKAGILEAKYADALALMNAGKYESAIKAFGALDYKDSKAKAEECRTALTDEQYNKAVSLMAAQKYAEAAEILETLDYKDSAALLEQCDAELVAVRYEEAVALMANEKYSAALNLFEKIDYKDSAKLADKCRSGALYENTRIGDKITFGRFEQDNDKSNGPEDVVWRVLDKQDGKVLILTDKVIEVMPFFAIYWRHSSIGGYLESSFINDFTPEEKAQLVKIRVSADKHPDYPDTDQGSDPENKLFLLSVDEVLKYLPDEKDRIGYPTATAVHSGLKTYEHGECDWWLRTACKNWSSGAIIANIDPYGYVNASTHNCRHGLRPACWINLVG